MNKFDEFMDEVENDIRQARLEKYWKKYGKQFVAVCLVLLGSSAFYTLYNNRQEKLSLQSSDQFIAAQNAVVQGNYDEALIVLENIIQTAPNTYKMLGLFSKVGVFLKKDNQEDMVKAFDLLKEIENQSGIDQYFKTFARLLRYFHQINLLDMASDDFNKIRLDIDKVAGEDNVWSYMAKEIKGLILNRVGSHKEALEMFVGLIQDPKTPQIIKVRSQLMAQLLSSQKN